MAAAGTSKCCAPVWASASATWLSFTPATAVPTEALDALRASVDEAASEPSLDEAYYIRVKAMRAFLAAVDTANGSPS